MNTLVLTEGIWAACYGIHHDQCVSSTNRYSTWHRIGAPLIFVKLINYKKERCGLANPFQQYCVHLSPGGFVEKVVNQNTRSFVIVVIKQRAGNRNRKMSTKINVD